MHGQSQWYFQDMHTYQHGWSSSLPVCKCVDRYISTTISTWKPLIHTHSHIYITSCMHDIMHGASAVKNSSLQNVARKCVQFNSHCVYIYTCQLMILIVHDFIVLYIDNKITFAPLTEQEYTEALCTNFFKTIKIQLALLYYTDKNIILKWTIFSFCEWFAAAFLGPSVCAWRDSAKHRGYSRSRSQ